MQEVIPNRDMWRVALDTAGDMVKRHGADDRIDVPKYGWFRLLA